MLINIAFCLCFGIWNVNIYNIYAFFVSEYILVVALFYVGFWVLVRRWMVPSLASCHQFWC